MIQEMQNVASALKEREQLMLNAQEYRSAKTTKWIREVDELFRSMRIWLSSLSEEGLVKIDSDSITVNEKIQALQYDYRTCKLHLELVNTGTLVFEPTECLTQPPGTARMVITGLNEPYYLQWSDLGQHTQWNLVNDETSSVVTFDADSLGLLLQLYIEQQPF